MANFVDISLPEMDAFLSPLRFRRNNNLTYRGRPIKEIVYERTLPGKPNHIVRVYTTINRFGQKRGRGRKVGKDAIRVQVLYQDDQGEVLLYQPKRVHRVANWKTNLQNRLDEIISADINVVRDKRGQPMTLRTKGANKFWGSRDYPAYKETRRYESEQEILIGKPGEVAWRAMNPNDYALGLESGYLTLDKTMGGWGHYAMLGKTPATFQIHWRGYPMFEIDMEGLKYAKSGNLQWNQPRHTNIQIMQDIPIEKVTPYDSELGIGEVSKYIPRSKTQSYDKLPEVKRDRSWTTRFDEVMERPGFWDSYQSEQVTESDVPDNWRLVTIADTQTNSFGKGLQRQFDFSDFDGNPYDAVWELIEIIDDLNNKLKHTAHTQFSYERVLITLYTDDVGNLTNKDFIWAEEFNDFYDDDDELIMMSERETKVMVINTLDGKLHSIVKWMYYPDGSKNYEIVATPKPVRNTQDPHQIQKFYTALGVSSHIYDMNRERFKAESYPSCYLCGLPAKLEVMTAVGMRNFCSNKCRGYYEGVDYGDYDSPKLEHQLKITKYDQGRESDYYDDGRESKLTIDCANCPLHLVEDIPEKTDLFSDYRSARRHTIKTWNEEWEDYEEEPCINHDLVITRYLSNSESYDGIRLGEIAFRCSKCGYRDMIYADIPEGCSNTGRVKPTMSQIRGTNQTDRIRLP